MMEIRKAIVTGASRGIGFAIAKMLVSHNVDIVITGTKAESLEKAGQKLESLKGGTVYPIVSHLEREEAPSLLMRESIEALGALDLLVNNAGISLNTPLESTTVEQWNALMNINARSPYFLCKEALPHLKESKAATIVQIASVVAQSGYINQSAYAASKHALLGFTKSFAKEVHPDGIRVYTISPGGVATDLVRSVRPDIKESELIKPEQIATLIEFILTNRDNGVIDYFDLRRESKTPWA